VPRRCPEPFWSQRNELYLTEPLRVVRHRGGHVSAASASILWPRGARFRRSRAEARLGLRRRLDEGRFPWRVLPRESASARLRRRSGNSVQLSGNTVYVSQPGECCLRKNLQVLQPPVRLEGTIEAERSPRHPQPLRGLRRDQGQTEIALAFRWRGKPSFQAFQPLPARSRLCLANTIQARKASTFVLDGDVGIPSAPSPQGRSRASAQRS